MKPFLFSLVLFLSTLAFVQEKGPYYALLQLYPTTDEHHAVRIKEGENAGERFSTELPFHKISVTCPSYSNSIGTLRLSLYTWAGSAEKSRAGKVIARETFVDFPDNETLSLEFEQVPAGDYYWELDEATEAVGVWQCPGETQDVQCFLNGEPIPGAYTFSVEVSGTAFPFSGPMELYEWYSAPSLAPAETDFLSDPDGNLTEKPFEERDLFADTWDAMDELGRTLGTSETFGPPRQKHVGIFYWTWHENFVTRTEPRNNAQIIRENPGIESRPDDPHWGVDHQRNHWDEPLFGFYRTTDPWVSRRHAQLLSEAGIDVVVFDATNGTWTWMDSTWTLLKTWSSMRRDGFRTPKFAYMLPFGKKTNVRVSLLQLYRDIYKPGKFRDLWFYWNGRPLVNADPAVILAGINDPNASEEDRKDWEEILRFFTFRPLQPSYTAGPIGPNSWCWLEAFPQHAYGPKPDGTFEMCAAGVAQNHSWLAEDGHKGLAAMNDQNVFGRAYMGPETEAELKPGEKLRFAADRNPRRGEPNRFIWGENFAQQLNYAQKIDPDYLFITGWNEWSADKAPLWQGKRTAFPDQYSPEFSRDTEPSAGILRDHFYNQLVNGVRRFRGVRPQRAADENPVYRDARNDVTPRDAAGCGSVHYVNRTGRNDFVECFVTHDAETLTFTAECAAPLTPPTDPAWMRLFVSVAFDDSPTATPHWNHFQYVVNRLKPADGQAILEVCAAGGGWNWKELARVPMKIDGNRLEIQIPRELICQKGKKIDLRFKWADNSPEEGEILDFYHRGDAAPDGRFVYRYFER
ncbi:MAG: hypothetical protein IJU53_14420 [Thermoguttaceae bacterium]|nr:hypothetical protein [Thermoguttaceae bacterium]